MTAMAWKLTRNGSVGDPDEPSPLQCSVLGNEVPRGVAPQAQPFHHGLRAQIVGRGVAENLGRPVAREEVHQGCPCSFGGVPKPPSAPHETPTNVEMSAKRMVWRGRHDADVADELATRVFQGPAAEPEPIVGCNIACK